MSLFLILRGLFAWCAHRAAVFEREDHSFIGVITHADSDVLVTARNITKPERAQMTTGNTARMLDLIDINLYRRLLTE